MFINLKPLDTLFFRDSKPFNMGEDTWADGIFPPYPSVYYGALRSHYFAGDIEKLSLANENGDPTADLIIERVYFKIGSGYLLPTPRDLVARKSELKTDKANMDDDDDVDVKILSCEDISSIPSSCPLKYALIPEKKDDVYQHPEGSMMSTEDLSTYFRGRKHCANEGNNLKVKLKERYLMMEPKVGIARNNFSRSSLEGMLYRVGMNRLKGLSISIRFDNLQIPDMGIMKLGGEGKTVKYEKESEFSAKFEQAPEIKNGKFKIYLSTPAIFNNGWIPGWLNKNENGEYTGEIPGTGCKVRLLAAAVGKPCHIGGFDMKKKRPKPMRTAVPSGSVYYFEVISGNLSSAINKIHGSSISDDDYYRKQGFGISFCGEV